ncbi:hypothetical protein NW733_04965 [Mycoplasmopsis felis]|uniref:hypothetical protein n=1 Tax=Mycoplasmopsis felis TaxID=33923 RepID=UPI0021E0BF58|nr:hypothetical protein [Mycoplasmopsis felis]MCU9931984.1 hypothetical protein [Mycoplasmopsis felis]
MLVNSEFTAKLNVNLALSELTSLILKFKNLMPFVRKLFFAEFKFNLKLDKLNLVNLYSVAEINFHILK